MTRVRTLNAGLFTALWMLPVIALLQSSLVGHFEVKGILPAVTLIVVVDWGILRGPEEGMLWAFIGGVCTDVFTGWPMGTSTIAMVAVASVVSLGGGTFIRTHTLLPLATVFCATILYYLVAMFILESTHHSVAWIDGLRYVVIPVAVYNAALNIPGFWLIQRLEQRVYPVERASW
jgi:rod shape-determining protein MreD